MCIRDSSCRIPRSMRFFLDSASPEEARKVRDWGLLDGVWLSAASAEAAGIDYRRAVRELASVTDGPVCVEPGSDDAKGMYKAARELAKLGKAVSYTHLRAHETRHDIVC